MLLCDSKITLITTRNVGTHKHKVENKCGWCFFRHNKLEADNIICLHDIELICEIFREIDNA